MTPGEIFAALLDKRAIVDRERFLAPSYPDHLHDPFLLPDMRKAVNRLVKAREHDEIVAIYGDYDIDGLTASTLLNESFTAFGIKSFVHIPNRFKDGYGLSKRGIEAIHEQGAGLVVTVDCGSRSIDEVALAKQLKMDVVVTDHHSLGDDLPKAVAVVNPKRTDSKYPFSDLAGCGVAFKLVTALQTKLEGLAQGQEKWLLDLVALGTVCDVVDLIDENRVLVKWGLTVMRRTRRPGLKALAAVSQTPLEQVDPMALGFRFGPRLNAAGRLETAMASLQLLTSQSSAEAIQLATTLDQLNYQRRTDQDKILQEALELARQQDDPVLIVASPGWSHGIVGIVASRLVEVLGKPAFVMQDLGETIKGSARSFGDFHLAEALKQVEELLVSGGGHALAAGATIKKSDFERFRTTLNDYYRSLKLTDQEKYLHSLADVELEDFGGLTEELLELMDPLQPFGHGNPQPLFGVSGLTVAEWRPVGSAGSHAKVRLRDRLGNHGDAIGFGLAEQFKACEGECALLLHLERNTFNGRTSLQYRIQSFA